MLSPQSLHLRRGWLGQWRHPIGHHAEMALPQMEGGNLAVLGGSPLGQMLEAQWFMRGWPSAGFQTFRRGSEFMPTRPQHAGLFVSWRPEIATLQIPQRAAE